MNRIDQVFEFAKSKLNEVSAHDFEHSERVYKVAKKISSGYDVNHELVEVSAIAHDIIDKKVSKDVDSSKRELWDFLLSLEYTTDFVQHVFNIIENMSYSSGRTPVTLEGKIVQDADRLDAIGAISIARCFAYGGKMGRHIYDEVNDTNSIQHFYDKLLLLKDRLNTKEAKKIAQDRHHFMEEYLKQFFIEWNLEDIK